MWSFSFALVSDQSLMGSGVSSVRGTYRREDDANRGNRPQGRGDVP
jgi:hypothetical protein